MAIRIDKQWEGPANRSMAVFRHGGRLMIYYRILRNNAVIRALQ